MSDYPHCQKCSLPLEGIETSRWRTHTEAYCADCWETVFGGAPEIEISPEYRRTLQATIARLEEWLAHLPAHPNIFEVHKAENTISEYKMLLAGRDPNR